MHLIIDLKKKLNPLSGTSNDCTAAYIKRLHLFTQLLVMYLKPTLM